jgi:hypothetical protein
MTKAFGLVSVAAVFAAVYGCSSDDATTASVIDGGAGDAAQVASDGGGGTTSDGSADGASTPPQVTACADAPDAGTNPTCGVVGACGQLVAAVADAADLPAGPSTTLPAGTYVLTGVKVHKLALPSIQLALTARFASDGTYQRIESVTINGQPDSIDERKSGTYTVASGVVTLVEVCPAAETDDPSTFTVNGSSVTFYTPQVGGAAGQGIAQTYTVIPL